MNELLPLLVQSSGAAGVTGIFIFYLLRHDKQDRAERESFNKTIQNHLYGANLIQKESNKVNKELSVKLGELTRVINDFKNI